MSRFQTLQSVSTCAATPWPDATSSAVLSLAALRAGRRQKATRQQGLTLVHFSSQPEPCSTQKMPSAPSNTPRHPLGTP
jgi:hypothetical protein